WHGDCGVSVRNRQAKLSGAKRRQVRRGLGVQGKGAAAPLPLLPRCRRRNSWGAAPNISANLSCLGLKWLANFRKARFWDRTEARSPDRYRIKGFSADENQKIWAAIRRFFCRKT